MCIHYLDILTPYHIAKWIFTNYIGILFFYLWGTTVGYPLKMLAGIILKWPNCSASQGIDGCGLQALKAFGEHGAKDSHIFRCVCQGRPIQWQWNGLSRAQTYLPWVHGGRLPRNVDFVLQSSKHRLLHRSQNKLILMGVYMIWRASHWSGRTALGVSLPRPAARYGRWVVELFSWIIIPLHPDICLGLFRELVIFGQIVVIGHEQMWV